MSTPVNRRNNSLRQVAFFTLAGVSSLSIAGEDIVVTPKDPLPELHTPKGKFLCEEFANWPNDLKGVLQFTNRYGVLGPCPSHGETVSFRIADWQADQSKIRSAWDLTSYVAKKFKLRPSDSGQTSVPVEPGEELICRFGQLEYRTNSLIRLIRMEFASIRPERLRKCGRPNCESPYFVATHLGQRYCTDRCAQWAQRELKRNWWKESGEAWRKKRDEAKKQRPQNKKRRGGIR